MTITMTEKEYEALQTQLEGDYESATDEEYCEMANKSLKALYNVSRKYKAAREKANEFQRVRMFVAEKNRNRGLRPRDIDALTRKVIKKMREDKQ